MSPRSASLPLLVTAALATVGCTVITDVDVCEDRGPSETDLNKQADGNQALATAPAIAPLTEGGAFVVFDSTREGESAIRYARVAPSGSIEGSCLGGHEERTLVTSDATVYGAPAVAFPRTAAEMRAGLVVYSQVVGGRHLLWAKTILESGCPLGDPFVITEAPLGFEISSPRVVSVGNDNYVASWNELNRTAPSIDLRGRVVAPMGPTGRFLPTRPAPDGSAATIPPDGNLPGVHTSIFTGDGRFGLVWLDTGIGVVRIRFAVFNDRFEVVSGPIVLDEKMGIAATAVSVAGAFDDGQFMLVWVLGEPDATSRAEAVFVDTEARFLRSERSPEGFPFRLDTAEAHGVETQVAVSPLDGGGFLAAWTLLESAESVSGLDTYAIAFDANGTVMFSKRACERTHFAMNQDREGDQQLPALATLSDGTTLFMYVNQGGRSFDRSGTGIRSVGLRASDLVVR